MGFIFGVDSAGKFYVEGANVSGELSVGDGLIDVISMDVAAESLVVENYSGEIVEGDVLYWGNAGGNLGYYTVTGTNPLSDGSVEITFLEDIEYDLIVEQGFLTKTFDLSANLGPVGINIDDGTFAVEAGFVLGATGRFSTSTMQEDSDGDLFGDATVDTSAAYHLLLPLAPDVGVEGLPLDQGIMYASYNNDVPSAGLVGALASLPNALQIEGLDKLLSLSAVSLDQLLAGLSSLLGNLVDPDSVYFEDIPAVGKSLADLLSIDESTLEAALVPLGVKAKDILGTANDDQTSLDLISALKFGVDELRGAISNIQDFEGILNNFVNTLMGLQLNPFTVTYENSTLSVDMDLKTIFSEELGFDLDLQQLTGLVPSNPLGDLSSFIGEDGLGLTASASGSLLAEASAGLDLGFSFDLSNITNPTLLIDGDSGLQTGLSIVNTSPLNLALGIDVNIAGSDVPLSVSVIDGTVDIELDAFYGIDSPHDQLALVLSDGLKFEDPDGNLILIDDVVGGRVDGQAEISLPLYFPVASLPFGGSSEDGNQDGVADNVLDLSFALAETGITDVELRAPELGGAFSLAAVLNDPATILKGLEGMFDGLKNVVSGRFSSLGLPLIGDALKGIDSFFDDMRDDLLGKKTNSAYQSGGLGFELEQAINNGDSVVELIQEALFNNLGEFLVAPKTDAGGVLQYQDNGMLKTKAVTSPEDIQLSFITDDSGTALQFNVLFAGELFNESLPIDFSMDALGFGIEVGDDSRVNLMSQYILGLGLGIDTSGFYLDTSGVTASGDELAFDINATLAKGTQVKGALGFLQATLTEVSNDGDGPSGVFGYVGVNLTDNDDDRFRPGETLAASVGLTASANIDFDAKLDFSPSGGAIALPEITSTIHYDQVFANVQLTSNGSTSSPPGDADIMFEDVTLDVGSFIKDFLGPIVTEVKNGIDPIMPLLDLFKQDIGLLVDLQAPATSLLGIAELAVTKTNDPKLGSILATYKSIENLIELIKLIDSFTSNTSAGQSGLNFGNFSLIDGVMVLDREGVDADETGSNPAAAQIIAAATTAVATGGVMPAVFELPLLSSPLAIADLITGNRAVDLFRYSLPALDFSLSGGEIQAALAEFGVPALPGFDVGLLPSSTIKLQTRFALGLDTSGIDDWRKAGATPLGLPLALLNGFFLDDHVVSGVDEPEAYLKTTLNFGAELDTPVLKAGAIGNITSEISLNLNDVGINDGKLYGDEVIEQLGRGPQCLFDSSGQISAGFEAYLWVGVDLGFFGTATLFDESYTLANIIIANFDHSCSDMAPPSIGSVNKQALDVGNPAPRESLDDIRPDGVYDQDGNLVAGVWDANGSTLTLNIGDLGKLRGDDFQGKNERVEVNQTRIEVVLDGVLQEKDVLQVTYEGFTRNFVNVKSIAADGGAGNDVILIGSSVTLDVLLEGGEGNDHLRYLGQGSAEIYGGKGNDILIGRSEALEGDGGADYLDGGDGNDVIDAGIGDDEIYGGAGNDRISGGEGNDYIEAGSGEDRVAGNDGDDEIYGDGGDDTLTGDSGNDRLFGGDGSDRIYGVEGDDIISGDDGDDLLVGGEGADVLRGADGDDRITWADGDGSDKTINGGAGSDSIRIEASAADDNIEISAVEIGKSNGVRVSVDGSALDSRSVERISLDAGDGADTLVIGDIEGSSVKAISYDLGTIANKQTTKDLVNQRINGESPAEAKADGKTDSVTIHGGQSDSVFRVVNEEPDLTRVTLNNDQLTITLLNRDLHKKNKTEGDLSILGGGGENTLIVDNSADTANRNGIKLTPEALIFPHLSGDLLFSNIGTVDVKLGSGKDRIDIDGSVGNTSLDTGAGNDVVNVSSLIGKAEILMGAGADEITLWQEDADVAPGALDLTIDGGTEGDTYTLNVPGASSDVSASSLININDSGVGGEDKLTYKGSSDNDTLQLTKDAKTGDGLIIAHYGGENSYNAAGDPSDFTDVEVTSFGAANHQIVVNYSTVDVINLFAGAGDDKIVSDYTAQSIDVRAGDGDDQIYIGSVLETESVLVQGVITTVVKEITDGANFTADYFGGDGDDYFEVNHNAAEIGLFGDNGSDVFFVKALLTLDENEEVTSLESKLANIKAAVVAGKSGLNADGTRPAKPDTREVDLDSLIYVQNANINIDGGAGVDAVTLVGTALSDTFYIFTETVDGKVVQRILGAGVKLDELVNIERVQLLTGSGDDIVYVYGVDLGDSADLLINTGSGSDQVIFGGPELTFDLQFPASNETQFTAAEGFRLGGGFRIDYGLSIRTITSTDRIVPFTIEKPAVNRTRTINASFSINNYRNPVLVTDSDGLADTITINNKQGATSLVFDTALLETKSISVVSSKIEFPQSDSRKTTDLIAQFYTLSNGDKGAIRNTISDVVTNQLLFADRYLDNELLNRMLTQEEVVLLPKGTSYAALQTGLNGQELVSVRTKLADYLKGTGFKAVYTENPHPDPDRAANGEVLYELDRIVNESNQRLQFEAQYSETVFIELDGTAVVYRDIAGVSLITARNIDLTLKAGFLKKIEDTGRSVEQWNVLHQNGQPSNIYFDGYDEVAVNLSEGGQTSTVLRNSEFDGILEVNGGSENDKIILTQAPGVVLLSGGAGDDEFEVRQADASRMLTDIYIEGGAGQDTVKVSTVTDTADEIEIEKKTLQEDIVQNRLDRVSNVLDFENVTAGENAAINTKLRREAVEVAELFTLATSQSVRDVADSAAQASADEIATKLRDALNYFKDELALSKLEREAVETTYVSKLLREYLFAEENKRAAKEVINLYERKADKMQELLEKHKESNVNGNIDVLLTYLETRDTELYDRLADAGTGLTKQDDNKLLNDLINVIINKSNKIAGLELSDWMQTALDRLDRYKKILSGAYKDRALWSRESAELKLPLREIFSSDRLKLLVGRTIDGEGIFAVSKDMTLTEIVDIKKEVRKKFNNVAAETESLIQAALSAARDLKNNDTGDVEALARALHSQLSVLDELLARSGKGVIGKYVGLIRADLQPLLVFAERNILSDAVNLYESMPSEKLFNLGQKFLNDPSKTWLKARNLFAQNNYQPVIESIELAARLAGQLEAVSVSAPSAKLISKQYKLFEVFRDNLEGGFDFERFKSVYEADEAKLVASADILGAIAEDARLNAQLASLMADRDAAEKIIQRNQAVTKLFENLKSDAAEDRKKIRTELEQRAESSFSFSFFGSFFGGIDTSPLESSRKYQVADSVFQDAKSALTKAEEKSEIVKDKLAKLNDKIQALEKQITKIGIEDQRTELVAVQQRLSSSFKFLNVLGTAMVDVISNSRADQSGEGFGNQSNLVSKIVGYSRSFDVTNTSLNPISSNELEKGANGQSVLVSQTTRQVQDVLSVSISQVGTSVNIHANYDDIESIQLTSSNKADVINIHDTLGSENSLIGVASRNGADVFTVTNQNEDNLSGAVNSLNDFVGNIFLNAGNGRDRLVVDDSGDKSGDDVSLLANGNENLRLTGLAKGDLTIRPGNFEGGYEILTGSGRDTVTISNLLENNTLQLSTGGGSDDVVFTEFSADTAKILINTGNGADVVDAELSPVGITVFAGVGRDTIRGSNFEDEIDGGNGNDLLIGNLGADILVGGQGSDWVIGDAGEARNAAGESVTLRDMGSIVFLGSSGLGGDDQINAGFGNNIVIGGIGNDQIVTEGSGNNVIIGDDGHIDFSNDDAIPMVIGVSSDDDVPFQVETNSRSLLKPGRVPTISLGYNDDIIGGSGNDLVIGGAGADAINTGDGDDIAIGDGAEARYVDEKISSIQSVNPEQGGNDTIIVGTGRTLIVGGAGSDSLSSGGGDAVDVIVGGTVEVNFDTAGAVANFNILAGANDGADVIKVESGAAVIVGNGDSDVIQAGQQVQVVADNPGTVQLDETGTVDLGDAGDSGEPGPVDLGGADDPSTPGTVDPLDDPGPRDIFMFHSQSLREIMQSVYLMASSDQSVEDEEQDDESSRAAMPWNVLAGSSSQDNSERKGLITLQGFTELEARAQSRKFEKWN
jgi:Ca2+-binding RTX toxin-like protein